MKKNLDFHTWKNIGRFLAYVWDLDKINLIGNGLIRLISTFVPIVSLYVGKLIIDEIVYEKDTEKILFYVLIEAIIVIGTNILSRLSSYLNQKLNYNYELFTTKRLIEKFNSLSLHQVENAEVKNKFYLAKNESHDGSSLIDELLGLSEAAFSIVTFSIAVIAYKPLAILAFVGTAVIIFLSETHFYAYIYKLQRAWIPERRKADYYCDLLTDDKNFKEIRLFNTLSFFSQLFFRKKQEFQQKNLAIQKKRLIVNAILYAINLAVYYYIYLLFIQDVISGIITVGTLTYISGLLLNLRNRINGLFNTVAWLNDRASYLGDFFAFFSLVPDMKTHNNDTCTIGDTDGLVFSHVSYKYENKEDWAVKDLNFKIKTGEKVLIMGVNGSGKTTIIKLICKLYQPTEGTIYLNGRDIQTLDNQDYYRQINAIFQDYIKYEMTAAENIGVGDVNSMNDLQKIKTCAEKCGVNSLIESFPNKYSQQLGKLFKNGIQLSGGEWQKLAIARAQYGNHPLLLLDEPSSALDIISEHKLYQDLLNSQVQKEKTIVIVSHRINNLNHINHIIILKNGRIAKDEILKNVISQNQLFDEMLQVSTNNLI